MSAVAAEEEDTLEEFKEFLEEVEKESVEVEASFNEAQKRLGTNDDVLRTIIGVIQDSLLPSIKGIGQRALMAIADLAAEVDGPDGSVLEIEDATKITMAILKAAELIAIVESTTLDEDRKKQCSEAGELLSEALKLVKEITVEQELEDGSDDDTEDDEE